MSGKVTGHQHLCQHNPTLRRLIEMRNPYIDPINILQVQPAPSSVLPAGMLFPEST